MINNRQAGRRRGRNNPRQNTGGNRGGGDSGNRIDNRARGNATQLLEKYRNMARDAQLAGDRVNAEYYLQFADHYFRVLADNRARQEEQQARFRRPDEGDQDQDDDGDDYGDFASDRPMRDQRFEPRDRERDDRRQPQQQQQPYRAQPRTETSAGVEDMPSDTSYEEEAAEVRPARRPRTERPEGVAPEPQAAEAPRRPRGRPRRRAENDEADEAGAGLDLAVLPPSIARPAEDSDTGTEAPKPRRTRRPRSAEAAE